jgi:uncharacterized protein HemX
MRFDDGDEPAVADSAMKTGLLALLVVLGLVMLGGAPAGFWMLKQRQHEAAVAAEREAAEQARRAAEAARARLRDAEQAAQKAAADAGGRLGP